MKLRLTAVATAALLASGMGMASAASNQAMSNTSTPSAMQPMAKDGLSLTRSQQRTAWNDIRKLETSQAAPSGFTAAVGTTVPNEISLKSVPSNLAARVSALKPYDYALVQGKLLIVNPGDKKVVEVIHRRA
jgi:uncharacterized protein (DUF2342 family)